MRQQVDHISRPGDEDDIYQLVSCAQDGDLVVRDQLIRQYTPFVMKVAVNATKRYLTIGKDDEASIALIAFNEAISGYKPEKGRSFFSFAETVIHRRLVDFFRKNESKAKEIPASSFIVEGNEGESTRNAVTDAEAAQAMAHMSRHNESMERQEEILRYREILADFKINLEDLVEDCPKHVDARQRALEAAKIVAQQPGLRDYLRRKRELPLKELEKLASVSRKTLERQRKYIIALTLIMVEDLVYLREYLK